MKHLKPIFENQERSLQDMFKGYLDWKLISYVIDISTKYADDSKLIEMNVEANVHGNYYTVYFYNSISDTYHNGKWSEEPIIKSYEWSILKGFDEARVLHVRRIVYTIQPINPFDTDDVILNDLYNKLTRNFPTMDIQKTKKIIITVEMPY